MIKLFKPYIPKNAIKELKKTLYSGSITQGAKVEEFEKEFKKLFKVDYAVSLNSGTSALETAYDLIGLKKGDEVISTSLSCSATNMPLLARGCKIIWADIDKDTLCINVNDVFNKMTKKTKAVVQTHLGGVLSEFPKLHGDEIKVVSDACQALGIFTGNMTACSFQAIKHITTGDGGMLVVDNKKDYKKAKLMRWFGIDREKKINNDWTSYKKRMMSFDIDIIGYKRHMNDIDATLGLCGLRDYKKNLEHREKIFNLYRKRLNMIDGLQLIDNDINMYWLATLLVENRDKFAKKLWEAGIETNLVQIRNDSYKIFGGKKTKLPYLDSIEDRYISIPIGPHVSINDAARICDIIKKGW